MQILDEVKTKLRINHNKLDGEIMQLIFSAMAEIKRAGVLAEKAQDALDPLINLAIKTFVQMEYTTDTNKAERFLESFKYQLDCMRKSEGYYNVY